MCSEDEVATFEIPDWVNAKCRCYLEVVGVQDMVQNGGERLVHMVGGREANCAELSAE